MIVRRRGGMTEFIPSPQEKREGLIRDHTLDLLENLHRRLERVERLGGFPLDAAHNFSQLLAKLRDEESRNDAIYNQLTSGGITEE